MIKNLQNLKKIAALTIALLAVSLGVNAQTWYILGEYIWSPPHPQGTFRVTQTSGDNVVINGLDYTTLLENNAVIGAYRNDGNQVYYCKWNGSDYDEEVLFYDYDLEVGDFFNDEDEHPMQVVEVSTILDYNDVERKMITFEFTGLPEESEYWIEGVGSSRGFANVGRYTPTEDGAIFSLLCYHEDWRIIYINPVHNTCDVDEIAENAIDNGISIYPNPANEIVKILNDNNMSISSIEILDLTGRIVMSCGNTDDIDISELTEGQYFVRIIGETTIIKKLFISK